jgi:hypothetical protein
VQSEKTNEINQKKDPNTVELSSLSWPTLSPRPAPPVSFTKCASICC